MDKIRLFALMSLAMAGVGGLTTPTLALQMNGATYATANQPVSAVLTSKLDTKSASAGEKVTAKTLAESVLANNVTVPRGAILSGKVSEVQSKSTGNGTASMTVVFDQIQPGKNAPPIAIHGILVGVAPKPYLSGGGPSASNLPLASTRSQTSLSGETGQNIDNSSGGGESVAMGSSVRGVSFATGANQTAGTLSSSHKDFKLDRGTRIAVGLNSK